MKYQRVLLKLSGEALMEGGEENISINMLNHYAQEVKSIVDLGVQVALVIGGGNIFRGVHGNANLSQMIERNQGDYMGMLATMINGLALQSAFEKMGMNTRLQSAIEMNKIAEPYIRRRVMRHLEKGRVVILGSGTGNPFFTTDTTAILRGLEIQADVMLKGTKVDGIYSDDPNKNKDATKFDSVTYDEVIKKNLNIMDMTAFTLSQENSIPIIVFNINKKGDLKKIIEGENIGTKVI